MCGCQTKYYFIIKPYSVRIHLELVLKLLNGIQKLYLSAQSASLPDIHTCMHTCTQHTYVRSYVHTYIHIGYGSCHVPAMLKRLLTNTAPNHKPQP